jgi:hypothetical protein
VVFGAECFVQEPFLRADTGDDDGQRHEGDYDADAGAERQAPPEYTDQQAEIAWMAYDAVDPAGDQAVSLLNRDKAAEATPEHEHRRQSEDAPNRIERDAEPTYTLAIEAQKVDPVDASLEGGA